MQKCTPHRQCFVWELRSGTLWLRVADSPVETWLEYGSASALATELQSNLVGGDLLWHPAKPSGDLLALAYNAAARDLDDEFIPTVGNSFSVISARHNARITQAEIHFLARLGAAIGRPLPPPFWHAYRPFPVLHPQFGPGYACATDGARVVLLAGASFGCDWFMAHRTNIVRLKPTSSAHKPNPRATLRARLLAEL